MFNKHAFLISIQIQLFIDFYKNSIIYNLNFYSIIAIFYIFNDSNILIKKEAS